MEKHFISWRNRKTFCIFEKIISVGKIEKFFAWRIELTEIFDQKISLEKPKQVLELGAGYSVRGFKACLRDENLVYIDADLPKVITRKEKTLKKICRKNKIAFPGNYHLVCLDVLKDDIFEKVEPFVLGKNKTLVLAEGLTLYFTEKDFGIFLVNIGRFLAKTSSSEFYSHEWIKKPNNAFYCLLLRFFLRLVSGSKIRKSKKTVKEFEEYLRARGLSDVKIYDIHSKFTFYSIFKAKK